MSQDAGEFVVGAYLQVVVGCDLITYNARPGTGGREGQAEFDVLGLDFKNQTAYMCEVATHLQGLNYGGKTSESTLLKVQEKYARQRAYAEQNLMSFAHRRYQFWSPYVPRGFLTQGLAQLEGLELFINEGFTECVDELQARAATTRKDYGNPFFRSLQILAALRR
jgi:hypothetical protein